MKGRNRVAVREVDLEPAVRTWLIGAGYTPYGEVGVGDGRADLVGVRDAVLVVVELKATPSLVVLDQALARQRTAGVNAVWIAVPRPVRVRRGVGAAAFVQLCAALGLGLLWVAGADVMAVQWPAWTRPARGARAHQAWAKAAARIRARLSPEAAAQVGGAQGSHWTPHKGVVRDIVQVLLARPPSSSTTISADALVALVPSLVAYARGGGPHARRYLAWAARAGLLPGLSPASPAAARAAKAAAPGTRGPFLVFDRRAALAAVQADPARFPGVSAGADAAGP